jgi:hypothetical protein
VRAPAFTLLVALSAALCVALGGCGDFLGDKRGLEAQADNDTGDDGAGMGGGAPYASCSLNSDCVAAGPKCCDCPTHAVSKNDPAQSACTSVNCPPLSSMDCGSPMEAACVGGACMLVCAPVACDPNISCPSGFATDANGCLTCECAGVASAGDAECTNDNQCARVRDDCCGCANGGYDTAVPTSEVAAHDAALMCPSDPMCPGGNVCAADLAARCIQGTCSLVEGPPPSNACGGANQAPCPPGEYCYVNADDSATMNGVGVCQP